MDPLFNAICSGKTPDLDAFIETFHARLPLLGKLKGTVQDQEWHQEGDVYTHTSMVLNALYRVLDAEQASLSPERRLSLVLATALHDIGKPVTTRKKNLNGRLCVVAPHHEEVGASYIAPLLLNSGLTYPILHQVLQLVANHMMPRRLVMQGAPSPAYSQLGRTVDLELLYYLAKADAIGRKCADHKHQVELIDLFRLECDTAESYTTWVETVTDELSGTSPETIDYVIGRGIREYESGLIYTPHEAIARAYPHLNTRPELILTCGFSGSGKSTWINNHFDSAHIISLDQLREEHAKERQNQRDNPQILNIALESLKKQLRNKQQIVWDATNLRRDFREKLIRAAESYHASVTLVFFHIDADELYKRNQSRKFSLPKSVLERQFERFQLPQSIEAQRFLVLDQEGNKLFASGYYESRP